MDKFGIIKEFFSNMRCSQCQSFFSEDSVTILRQENNYTVVKVVCSECGKNIGLAILGLDKEGMKDAANIRENEYDEVFDENETPITYDDVIDAHQFFENLGPDWTRYLPEIEK